MNIKKVFAVIVTAIAFPLLITLVNGKNTEMELNTLKGLKGVGVLVEDIHGDAIKAGLTCKQLQIDVELKLRKAGIKVLTRVEQKNSPGYPWLYVKTNIMRIYRSYVYQITVTFRQHVFLRREMTTMTDTGTWETGALGYCGRGSAKKQIRESVGDFVDEFINDYLKMNPVTLPPGTDSPTAPNHP